MRPRPDRVTASFFDPLPKPIPEHFSILISRDTARNKACQTYSAYNTYWPEAYMDPADIFLFLKPTNTLEQTHWVSSPQYQKMKKKHKPALHTTNYLPLLDPTSVQFWPERKKWIFMFPHTAGLWNWNRRNYGPPDWGKREWCGNLLGGGDHEDGPAPGLHQKKPTSSERAWPSHVPGHWRHEICSSASY